MTGNNVVSGRTVILRGGLRIRKGSTFVFGNSNPELVNPGTSPIDGVTGLLDIDGDARVLGGGKLDVFSARVGTESDDRGSLVVSGNGSEWHSGSSVSIGDRGAGQLQIKDSGTMQTAGVVFAAFGGSSATGEVTGNGSSLIAQRGITVGQSGTADFSIKDGAVVTWGTNAVLGTTATGAGVLTVSGAGSSFAALTPVSNTLGEIVVGFQGIGDLMIEDGGLVEVRTGRIAMGDGSIGTVTVKGEGSRWSMDELTLAHGAGFSNRSGQAILNIQDGGQVLVGNETVLYQRSEINLTGGTFESPTIDNTRRGAFHFVGGRLVAGEFKGTLNQQRGTLLTPA